MSGDMSKNVLKLKNENMKSNYRLTVHVENAKTVRVETGKKIKDAKGKETPATKSKTFTTLSFYCGTKQECIQKLAEVRSEHTIAKGKDYKKKDKFDKELFNISWVN